MNPKAFSEFMYWVNQRDEVHYLKDVQGLPKPWSADPIFQTTRFCNVQRELDKVTIWIKENWREPYSDHPNLAFAMCLARVVNLPSTLQELGFPLDWRDDVFIANMDRLAADGRKLWTGAYMVTGGYSAGGETKQQIMGRVLDGAKFYADQINTSMSLADASKLIQRAPGFGTFLAAQVIADLKYTPLLGAAPDWWSYCAPGPGSTLGLHFLYGRDIKGALDSQQFSVEVNALRRVMSDEFEWDLTAHDVQNCLCEFSKYWRIKYLGGRAKTTYPGA